MRTDDAQFSPLIKSWREPTQAEIGVLVRRYLDGPIDDEAIARLDGEFRELLRDPQRRGPEESAFRANGRRYLGQAWKELLSSHGHTPAPVELALWLAILTPGFPAPRWFCPAEVAGRWRQTKPGDATWELAVDGTFSTTDEHTAEQRATHWCVHLIERRGDLRRDSLWLTDGERHTTPTERFVILECTQDLLRMVRPGGDFGDVEYQLVRVG